MDLAFADQASLVHHMLSVHNEKMNVNLGFKYDSSDEEEKLPEDYYQRQAWKQKQREIERAAEN